MCAKAKIGLIELPVTKLLDSTGRNWTAVRQFPPLVSKQILIPQLLAGGFDVHLVNMKDGKAETEFGTVRWNERTLTKIMVGQPFQQLNARDMDVWGITANFTQDQGPATILIRKLASDGGRVVVGGSDAFGNPRPYLEAGAVAVVRDKSGAANCAALDYVLGNTPREPLTGVLLADGRSFPARRPSMDPEDWPLPSLTIVRQCLGTEYWEGNIPDRLLPIGSVFPDIGCDQRCSFCQTPSTTPGYRRMTPERTLDWFALQKQAGARSVICTSDQFLARILYKGGRDDVLKIMKGVRELGLAILWGNGLELKKATLGRGLPNGDLTPDEELVQALWGWDWKKRVGCYQAYIPAERPIFGRTDYKKLLPWEQHCRLLRTIVRAGVPELSYGVIVGLPDDSHETLGELEGAIRDLSRSLKEINPGLKFVVTPFAIRRLPGTPLAAELRALGLLRFEKDTDVEGSFYTSCADTKHISYGEVSWWQERLAAIGDAEPHWQGVTGIVP